MNNVTTGDTFPTTVTFHGHVSHNNCRLCRCRCHNHDVHQKTTRTTRRRTGSLITRMVIHSLLFGCTDNDSGRRRLRRRPRRRRRNGKKTGCGTATRANKIYTIPVLELAITFLTILLSTSSSSSSPPLSFYSSSFAFVLSFSQNPPNFLPTHRRLQQQRHERAPQLLLLPSSSLFGVISSKSTNNKRRRRPSHCGTSSRLAGVAGGGDSGSGGGSGSDTGMDSGGFDGNDLSASDVVSTSGPTFIEALDSGSVSTLVETSPAPSPDNGEEDSQTVTIEVDLSSVESSSSSPSLSSSSSSSSSSSDVPFFISQRTEVLSSEIRQEKEAAELSNKFNTTPTLNTKSHEVSRRESFQYGLVLLTGTSIAVAAGRESERVRKLQEEAEAAEKARRRVSLLPKPVLKQQQQQQQGNGESSTTTSKPPPQLKSGGSTQQPKSSLVESGRLETINFTQVAKETNINITLDCNGGCIEIDSKNFTKIRKPSKPPRWLPSFLTPSPQVIKEISQEELFVAATVAGSVTEIFRTSLLYPLQTVKTRIQSDQHKYLRKPPPLVEQFKSLGTNVKKHVEEGNLYAGMTPTLLVSVPATGIYYGARDVSKRMLSMMPMLPDVWVAVIGALIADIVSLSFRTPADALAVRRQAQNSTVGDWVGDSIRRLPMIIATDLPFLLSKVILNKCFIQGQLNVGEYAELAVFTAVVAAFLTTPFDVVRTRLLLDDTLDGILDDDDQDPEKESQQQHGLGVDVGQEDDVENDIIADFSESAKLAGRGVFNTMLQIAREGEGGVSNLYAGWLERVLYLGIGRAWLEPVSLIGYIGIRDAVLLEWF